MTTRDNAERNARALELHLAGVPYVRIAQAIGLASKSAAYEAVQTALRAKQEQEEQAAPAEVDALDAAPDSGDVVTNGVRSELARLDAMLTGLWPRARQGDVKAVDRVLKLGERRLALLNLAARTAPPAPGTSDEDQGEGVPRVADIAAARARRLAAPEGPPPS